MARRARAAPSADKRCFKANGCSVEAEGGCTPHEHRVAGTSTPMDRVANALCPTTWKIRAVVCFAAGVPPQASLRSPALRVCWPLRKAKVPARSVALEFHLELVAEGPSVIFQCREAW